MTRSPSPTRSTSTSSTTAQHIPLATLPGMAERTVTINSLSKTYSVTGWRVGWVIAAPPLTAAIRKVHDFLTVGAAAPLQAAGTVALGLPDPYYAALLAAYRERRSILVAALEAAGFGVSRPARRLLRHDGHRPAGAGPARTTPPSVAAWRQTRAWPPCPAPPSTRTRRSATPGSASPSPSNGPRSRPRPRGWRAWRLARREAAGPGGEPLMALLARPHRQPGRDRRPPHPGLP